MVVDPSLLNTQNYKVSIKGKVEQSREMSCALPYKIGIEKGVFGLTSTMVANFYWLITKIFTFRILRHNNIYILPHILVPTRYLCMMLE